MQYNNGYISQNHKQVTRASVELCIQCAIWQLPTRKPWSVLLKTRSIFCPTQTQKAVTLVKKTANQFRRLT